MASFLSLLHSLLKVAIPCVVHHYTVSVLVAERLVVLDDVRVIKAAQNSDFINALLSFVSLFTDDALDCVPAPVFLILSVSLYWNETVYKWSYKRKYCSYCDKRRTKSSQPV